MAPTAILLRCYFQSMPVVESSNGAENSARSLCSGDTLIPDDDKARRQSEVLNRGDPWLLHVTSSGEEKNRMEEWERRKERSRGADRATWLPLIGLQTLQISP
ncbi:hypothetical protein PanWU01x14_355230 [Parasponia andersonii]|uniref:Uncharacterized protein n=1 Tax=Parasponia andersonii TaxID=3476 RepID=A0A2P5A9B7_PARAD|nr:hypothetical protein PanWU01x14_355230 [Parasponia andersonii]